VQREFVRYEGDFTEQPIIDRSGQYYRIAAPRSQEMPERQDSLPRHYRYR
jgi:hypothetical protein